jgi:geranylgeranyl diphosphate synthase, type II
MYNQSELRKIVNKALVNLSYNTESERLIDPVRYILSIGGKRLRPVIALMACNMFNDKVDDALIPVTGLEVFHNFTLVHDDIMDNAPVRRGMATVHTKWNVNQAILSGDVMAFISNECFLQTPPNLLMKVFRIFNKAAVEVCIGQQLDMDYEKASIVSHEEYLRMIELKTAVLIASSAKIGALLGGADDRESDLLYEFGRNLGLAFQIQDDLLDTYGDMKIFGKMSGGDILAGKKTFLYIKAMEIAGTEQRKKLQEVYATEDSNPGVKIKTVTGVYDQLNIKTITSSLAKDYFTAALGFLDRVALPPERKQEMIQLTDSLVEREK